jgi:hypothetical protein
MIIRRLNPTERDLFAEAWSWRLNAPRWYQDSDKVFGPESFEEFMELAHGEDQADLGVFNPELVGLITLTMRAKNVYEAHLSAKRGTSVDLLSDAAFQVRNLLFEQGMEEGYVWVASKNHAVKRICANAGFYANFVTMLKGLSHGRPIEWHQLVTTRAQWEAQLEIAA